MSLFLCKNPRLVIVVLKVSQISLKPKLQTMIFIIFFKTTITNYGFKNIFKSHPVFQISIVSIVIFKLFLKSSLL